MRLSLPLPLVVLAALALGMIAPRPASAANGTWTNRTAGGNWGDPTKWTNGLVGDGQDAVVTFSGPLAQTVSNNINATFGKMVFNQGSYVYTLVDGTLTGWVSSGAVQINNDGAGSPNILSDLYLKNSVSNSVAVNLVVTVSNLNSGGAALTWTKWGPGTLNVKGDNRATWAGNWNVSAGILQGSAGSGWSLGTGAVSVASGASVKFVAPAISTVLTNASRIITGAGLVNFGQGVFLMTTSNDYSGGTLIAGNNRVALGDDSALGTGTITFNDANAKLSSTGGATRTLANDLVFTNLLSLGSSTDNGALIFNGAVNLGGVMRTLSISSPVTFNGVVTNGGINKTGVGTLTLAGANTYSGPTTNAAGTLALGVDNPLGGNTLVMSGGALRAADGNARALTNAIVLAANSTFGGPGTGDLLLGDVNLGGSRSIYVSNSVTTFGGVTTNGGITVAGGGRLVLNEAYLTNLAFLGRSSSLELRGGLSTLSVALTVGSGADNTLLVTNGARLLSFGIGGPNMVGGTTVSTGVLARITGPGSSWVITNSTIASAGLRVGGSAIGATSNRLEVLDGATLQVDNLFQIASASSNASWNSVLVSGAGSRLISLLQGTDPYLRVAFSAASLNSAYSGTNSLVVTNGALVDTRGLVVGNASNAGNFASIAGATLQFSTNSPDIQILGVANSNAIYVRDSTIAFRDVTNVNIKANWGVGALGKGLTNITWAGDNAFRLNNASLTNGGQDYVFSTGLGATNYTRLEMINGTTLWQGGSLTIGTNGSMLVSNTAATVANAFTNRGSVQVVNSTLSFSQSFTLGTNSSFTLRNATNTLGAGLVIASNSTFGGSGRIASDVTVTNFGTISPGTLTFSSNLTLLDSSLLVLEIGGTNTVEYDHLVIEGTLAKAGSVLVTNLGWTFADGNTFNFLDAAGWGGAFSLLTLPTLSGSLAWNTNAWGEGILSVTSAIPEPSVFALLGLGALFALRRKRHA